MWYLLLSNFQPSPLLLIIWAKLSINNMPETLKITCISILEELDTDDPLLLFINSILLISSELENGRFLVWFTTLLTLPEFQGILAVNSNMLIFGNIVFSGSKQSQGWNEAEQAWLMECTGNFSWFMPITLSPQTIFSIETKCFFDAPFRSDSIWSLWMLLPIGMNWLLFVASYPMSFG